MYQGVLQVNVKKTNLVEKKIGKQFKQKLHKWIDAPLTYDMMINIISHHSNPHLNNE